jgi:hypothetical protein
MGVVGKQGAERGGGVKGGGQDAKVRGRARDKELSFQTSLNYQLLKVSQTSFTTVFACPAMLQLYFKHSKNMQSSGLSIITR